MAGLHITFLAVTLLSFIGFAIGENICPDSMETVNNKCYFFSQSKSVKNHWDGARKYCQKFSNITSHQEFDLAIFPGVTFEEFSILSDYMEKKGYTSDVYVGAHDVDFIDDIWLWIDGTNLPLNFPLWDCNYPSSTSSSYQCATLTFNTEKTKPISSLRLRLRDHSCSTSGSYYAYFICGEISALTTINGKDLVIGSVEKQSP